MSLIHSFPKTKQKKKEIVNLREIKETLSLRNGGVINKDLTQLHPVSSRAADRAHSRERPLERRSMELSITTATLKRRALRRRMALSVKLPPDPFNRLILNRREREDPAAGSAERAVVIVEDPLVTVLVADVSQAS